jgi:hypothetical protein
MPTPSFHTWLEHRLQQVPDAGSLALLIARSGAAGGVSRNDLARSLCLPPETLEVLLRAMVVAGQVVVRKVNGEMVYRAAM